MLVNGYPPEKLSGYVETWLARVANVTHSDARYFYSNWLRAGGSPALIREKLLKWLTTKQPFDRSAIPGIFDGGRMVLSIWLEKSGDCEAVEPFVVQWLNNQQYLLEEDSKYLFLSWLNAGGNLEVIKHQLIEWLGRPPGTAFMEQEQVLGAWLKSFGMNRDDAEPFVRRWCDDLQNAAADRADFLVAHWRNVGGAIEVVRNAIEQRARILDIPTDVYFARTPRVRGLAGGLATLAQRIKSADRPALFLDEVQRVLLLADELPRVDLDHVLRRWIEQMGREGVLVLQVEFLEWVIRLEEFSQAPYTLAEMLGVNVVGELGQRVERLAIDELRFKRRIVHHLYIFRGWVRSGRELAEVHEFLEAWLSAGHGVSDIKCGEILRALQASKLGQQEWALQAVNQFSEKHGGKAFRDGLQKSAP